MEVDQVAIDEAMQFTVKTQEAGVQDVGDIATESPEEEMVVTLHKVMDKLLDYSILLMHWAAVAVDDKCYIFTEPSGTGKATHAINWLKAIQGAYIVNGDTPFVDVKRKLVFGSTWCGKEGKNVNASVPLAGVVKLRRGENSIR